MTSWSDLESAAPDLAAAVRARLDAHKHKLLATLRKDGSPRLSGIEAHIRDGELWLAGIPGSLKFADLRRDPRMALHSGSDDADPAHPADWPGDGKVSGRAVEITGADALAAWAAAHTEPMPPGDYALFRVDLVDAVNVRMGDPADHLVVDQWHVDRGRTTTAKH